jgi:nitrilase
MVKVAAIQMASGPIVSANLSEAQRLISDAVHQGAKFVVLPENFSYMGMSEEDILEVAEPYGKGLVQEFLSTQAKKHGIWLAGGTVSIQSEHKDKIYAALLLFNDRGYVAARYHKIHLFDQDLGKLGGSYNESLFTVPGTEAVVVDTPFGKLGLAVCYDLRFPELFRCMVASGVEIIAISSSFTATTGKAHWELLNRARAIENLCYVISAAQGGYHVNGRETHGDSMIVDPWGGILDRLKRGSGFVLADIDQSKVRSTRKNFPVLEHTKIKC